MSFYKEPLFHFALLGLVIFAWFAYLNPADSRLANEDQIIVDDQDIDRLIGQFQSTWQRPPTLDELTAMQNGLLRQEVLVREARALGLDRGDSVVRSRLSQKMEFLTTSLAQSTVPKDDVLQAHLAKYPDRFVQPGKVAFQQIGFGPNPDPETLTAALDALNSGADPSEIGTPSLLPSSIRLATAAQVDGTFGHKFFEAMATLPVGQWAGPVQSGYGQHLVRIETQQQATALPLDQIRDDVLFDWRRELKSELSRVQYEELKQKYEILTPTPDQIAERLSR